MGVGGGGGGVQVYGICSCRLVYKEVVKTLSNYKNLTSGDLRIVLVVIRLGVTGLKKG